MKIEVTRYEWQMVDGQPKIVISMVKLMEDDGTYIKFAKLKDIVGELSKHPVTFKPMKFEVPPSRPVENTVDYDSIKF